MNRRNFIASLSLFSISSAQANWWEKGVEMWQEANKAPSENGNSSSQFTPKELQKAFREALSIGSELVVDKLSIKDSFNSDPKIHINLPKSLQKVQSGLNSFGMGSYLESTMQQLELSLNRAAEAAVPEVRSVFLDAIKALTFEDIQQIYQGADDSATQFLRKNSYDKLTSKISPIVNQKMDEVGVINTYDSLTQAYRKQYPFLPNLKVNLSDHVVSKTLDGVFLYLAKEEAAIRKNPYEYGSKLLEKVFSKN